MFGDFYFVDGNGTPLWIPFPTDARVVEYELSSDAEPQVLREIETDCFADALPMFVALLDRERNERYWSVMPWIDWRQGEGEIRLFLPNCGGKLFVGHPGNRLDLFTKGNVSNVVLTLNETVAKRLANTQIDELSLPPETLWERTKERLESVLTLVVSDEDGEHREYFVLADEPGERVGPGMTKTANSVVLDNVAFGRVLERRVYEGGLLKTYDVPGGSGCSLGLQNHQVVDVVLNEWGDHVVRHGLDGDESVSAAFSAGQFSSISEFQGDDYKTYVTFADGGAADTVAHFTFDREGNRYRTDRSWDWQIERDATNDLTAEEARKLCVDALEALNRGEGELRTHEHTAGASFSTVGAKFYGLFTSGQSDDAYEDLRPRGFGSCALTTRERDILFSLLGRSRNLAAVTDANPSNVAGVDETVPTCALDVTLADREAFLQSDAVREIEGLLGHPIFDLRDAISPEGSLWLAEIPVENRGLVENELAPFATSIRRYPWGDAEGCAAVLVRCSPAGFASKDGTSLREREQLDLRVFTPSKWEEIRQVYASFIVTHGAVRLPDRFDNLSQPIAELPDFLQEHYLTDEALALLTRLDTGLNPDENPYAGWGSETSFGLTLRDNLVPPDSGEHHKPTFEDPADDAMVWICGTAFSDGVHDPLAGRVVFKAHFDAAQAYYAKSHVRHPVNFTGGVSDASEIKGTEIAAAVSSSALSRAEADALLSIFPQGFGSQALLENFGPCPAAPAATTTEETPHRLLAHWLEETGDGLVSTGMAVLTEEEWEAAKTRIEDSLKKQPISLELTQSANVTYETLAEVESAITLRPLSETEAATLTKIVGSSFGDLGPLG